MELAVLRNDKRAAMDALRDALGALRESWEAETTLNNLRLIRAARGRRGTEEPWLAVLDRELAKKAQA
jgi:hypothetical protein